MLLQCMAKKGAGILGGPAVEDGQGKGETALTSPPKMSSKRQRWTSPFPRLRPCPFLLFTSITHRFSSGPGEEKGVRIKRRLEGGGEHYVELRKRSDSDGTAKAARGPSQAHPRERVCDMWGAGTVGVENSSGYVN